MSKKGKGRNRKANADRKLRGQQTRAEDTLEEKTAQEDVSEDVPEEVTEKAETQAEEVSAEKSEEVQEKVRKEAREEAHAAERAVPKKKHKQQPPKKKAAPPRDAAAIARESIKHTRTGGIPDENEAPRRRRRPGGKRKTPTPEEIREARAREKNKRRIRTAAALVIVAVFAVTAYFTRKSWVPALEKVLNRPKETIVNDGEVKKGNFPLSFDEGSVSSIDSTGNYLLCLDKNQLKFYDEDGTETNSFSHNYADPVMKASDKRVLLYDKGGSSLMVVGRKSEMFSKVVKNRLIMAEIAENNNVAVVTSDEKYAGILTVYDSNGREIFTWSSSSSLINVTFDESGDGCFVTTYSSRGGTLSSVVRYFVFDAKDPVMQSESLPVLALQAMENDNGEYWVAGDTAFYKLDKDGKVKYSYEYQGRLRDFDLSRSTAAVALNGVQRRSAELLIFDSDSEEKKPDHTVSTHDGEPERVKIRDNKIILLKSSSINCYDSYGNLAATAECRADYSDFVYFGDNVYFCDLREVNKISFTT